MTPREVLLRTSGNITRPNLTKMKLELRREFLVTLVGTTTACKDATTILAERLGIADGGSAETVGRIQIAELSDQHKTGISTHVNELIVGYFPSFDTRFMRKLKDGKSLEMPIQTHAKIVRAELKVKCWVWTNEKIAPIWEYSARNPAPFTADDKDIGNFSDALKRAAHRNLDSTQNSGFVGKLRYSELAPLIRSLKRRELLDEALFICLLAVAAVENDNRIPHPLPYYTHETAIVLRKMKRIDDEIRLLHRWSEFFSRNQELDPLVERYAKLARQTPPPSKSSSQAPDVRSLGILTNYDSSATNILRIGNGVVPEQ